MLGSIIRNSRRRLTAYSGTCPGGTAAVGFYPLFQCLLQARGLKKQANEVREGNIVVLDEKLFEVIKYNYSQGHGRQLGVVQMDLRSLGPQKVVQQERRRPGEMMEVASLEQRPHQLLYFEGGRAQLMDMDSFEQREVDTTMFGESARNFLQEGQLVTLHCTEQGEAVRGDMPQMVTAEIVDTQPYVRGDSASATYKAAFLGSGVKVMVPPHVVAGDKITVDTHTGTFAGKASS